MFKFEIGQSVRVMRRGRKYAGNINNHTDMPAGPPIYVVDLLDGSLVKADESLIKENGTVVGYPSSGR